MRSWLILLGGLIVWSVHFFGIYGIGEFAPSRGLVLALTALCIAADLGLLHRSRRLPADEPFLRWRRSVAIGGALLSLVAVGWQGLPALVD
jgi:hypothetical protein